VVVHATLEYHVDLERRKSDALRRGYAIQHDLDGHIRVAHAVKSLLRQSVQADRDTGQTRILERLGFIG